MNTQKDSWSERHYKQFQEELAKIHPQKEDLSITEIVEKIKILEDYSIDKNRCFALFSQIDFYFLYLSKNAGTISGYTPNEIHKKGLLSAFKAFYWKQLPLAIKVHQWGNRFRKTLGKQVHTAKMEAAYCGMKLRIKNGDWKIFFLKQKILTTNKTGHPILSFLEIEDITTLYKSDYVWARISGHTETETINRAYFQDGKKKEYADLLSNREMEILHLIIAKKDNITISETLGISKNTVERHRKNMIARLGVTDMTALIYICRRCQLL